MGRYITASEAARRIGVTDKTVRKWIVQGKLDAHHVHPNQLAILETDVERIIRERRLYQGNDNQDRHMLLSRLLDVEQKIAEQEKRLATLEQEIRALKNPHRVSNRDVPVMSVAGRPMNESFPQSGPQNRIVEPKVHIPAELPREVVSAIDFAAWHNIHRTTMRRHCISGIQGDWINTIEVPKSGGRAGDKERWLTSDQQLGAVQFWHRHQVNFVECNQLDCPCHEGGE